MHGAGEQISAEMARRGLEVSFVGGPPRDHAEALEVVREALLTVNAELCAAIGPLAVPLAGDEIGLQATHVPELGLVGEALPTCPAAVVEALERGAVPSSRRSPKKPAERQCRRFSRGALAVGIGADRILFVTDVPGLLLGGAVSASIGVAEAERLLDEGALSGGIVPKLRAALGAARSGVQAEIGETAVVA